MAERLDEARVVDVRDLRHPIGTVTVFVRFPQRSATASRGCLSRVRTTPSRPPTTN
jgi:hypothetical protein